MVLRTLTEDERSARASALADAKVREVEERRQAEEEAQRRAVREAAERADREAAESRRKAEEERHRHEDEAKRKARPKPRSVLAKASSRNPLRDPQRQPRLLPRREPARPHAGPAPPPPRRHVPNDDRAPQERPRRGRQAARWAARPRSQPDRTRTTVRVRSAADPVAQRALWSPPKPRTSPVRRKSAAA